MNELAEHELPSSSLADNAIEIGPHRKGGTWLVPEGDAQAAIDRIDELDAPEATLGAMAVLAKN